MKKLLILFVLLTQSNFVLASDCKEVLTYRYSSEGHDVISVKFLEKTSEGNLKYVITTNYYGGDGADEVIMNKNCKILSRKTIWDE